MLYEVITIEEIGGIRHQVVVGGKGADVIDTSPPGEIFPTDIAADQSVAPHTDKIEILLLHEAADAEGIGVGIEGDQRLGDIHGRKTFEKYPPQAGTLSIFPGHEGFPSG